MITITFCLILLSGCSERQKQKTEEENEFAQNNMRDYLSRVAAQITDNALSDISSVDDWKMVRNERYSEFIDMMGIQEYLEAERTDLNVKYTGSIKRNGYRIDKLYYESLSGLYVPANLYIPDNIKSPAPAILYVCGHSQIQKVRYQSYPSKLAELGFVCLIIETIQWGEVKGEHWGCYANGWFNWYSRGYNPAGVELWNAIRALDLLETIPEVDANKLGVTGISGGGSQSWYIAAADPRIKAAAPVCGAGTLKSQIAHRTIDGHCDCMMPTNTYQIDFADIGALIAPRPLLICQANRDGIYTIESVRELYGSVQRIYDLYNEPQNVSLIETPGGHSYHRKSREKIHSLFLEHLMGKKVSPEEIGDIDTLGVNSLSFDELKVYKDGVPENDRTPTIQNSFVKLMKAPEIESEKELINFKKRVKDFLKDKTFGAFPNEQIPFDGKLDFRSLDGAKFGWNIYSFVPEKGWRLKVDCHWENDTTNQKPLMIVLRNKDAIRWEAEGFISGLNKDWNIAFFETRGVGETGWDPALHWHIRRSSAWTGRTIASMQVYDLLKCIEFCRTLPQVDASKIGIAASEEMSVVALYAALLDGKCHKLILQNPPATQDIESDPYGKDNAIEMLNCLRITDVNQIPALLEPTQTIFIGEVPETYKWSKNILHKLGKQELIYFKNREAMKTISAN